MTTKQMLGRKSCDMQNTSKISLLVCMLFAPSRVMTFSIEKNAPWGCSIQASAHTATAVQVYRNAVQGVSFLNSLYTCY
eukprot:1142891-Pleurochrysis_carterae.AAC.1